LEITSEEEFVPPTKTHFTLHDYIPKGFFGSDSSDDEPTEEEVAQYCMVSWAEECEELNAKHADNIQEVDQVTLRSGRQLPSPESARKGKEKEMIPEGSSSLANAKEQSEERAIPLNSMAKAPLMMLAGPKSLSRTYLPQPLFKFTKGYIKIGFVVMSSPS